ncbi:MAG: hypothetical protein V1820_03685 [archaeon]
MAPSGRMKSVALSLIVISILLRAAFFLSPTYYAEENISVAMALSIESGASPYADFFHAHPPLHLFLLAVFRQVSGLEPILSAKLLSLLLSVLMVFFIWRLGGPFSAAIFSCAFPSFYWFSFSLPLVPLSLFLLAAYFSERRLGGGAAFLLFSICAFLSEFSAATLIFPMLLFSGRLKSPGEKIRAAAVAASVLGIAFLLLSLPTGGKFLGQAAFSQLSGRFASTPLGASVAENLSQYFLWIFIYSAPLFALSLFSGDRKPLALSLFSGAILVLALPGLSNNTLQFLVPFLSISAGGFRRKSALPAVSIALAALSIFLLFRAGLFSPATPALDRIVSAAEASAEPGLGEIWGTPEAILVSIKTGIPVASRFFDTTPFSVAEQGAPPRPDLLVISSYYYESRIYGSLEDYQLVFSSREPIVGEIGVYKRKNLKTGAGAADR